MGRDREPETTIRADGDTWVVRLGEGPPDGDVRVLLFFCRTTDQRPYRVVEVAAERVPDRAALADLDERALRELFERSSSMGAPRAYPSY